MPHSDLKYKGVSASEAESTSRLKHRLIPIPESPGEVRVESTHVIHIHDHPRPFTSRI